MTHRFPYRMSYNKCNKYNYIRNFSDMNKEALIVVDYQKDFCPGGALAVNGGDAISSAIAKEMYLTRMRSGLVVASFDWHPKDHSSFASSFGLPPFTMKGGEMKWPDHCVAGTEGAEMRFVPDLSDNRWENMVPAPIDRKVYKGFEKDVDSYSAFGGFETPDRSSKSLEEILRETGVRTVRIVGLALDYCVGSTALDSQKLGFETEILLSGTASVAPESEAAMIEKLKSAGVRLSA